MANWSPDRQQAVQARCDRATRGPWVVAEHDNEPAPPAREIVTEWTHAQLQAPVTVIGIGVGLGRVKHTIWADPYDLTFAAHARQDLPDALAALAAKDAEIARLTGQLAECYRLTGADPDGGDDAMLAPYAMSEVKRLREEGDEQFARQQADLTRLAEVGKADRDRAERLLSALHWAGDISELKTDGQWWARKNWRTVILDALFPLDAKEAARE